jgi:hypothetical protein
MSNRSFIVTMVALRMSVDDIETRDSVLGTRDSAIRD